MNPKLVKTVTKKIEGHVVEIRAYRRKDGFHHCLFDFLDLEHCSGATESPDKDLDVILQQADHAAIYKLAEWGIPPR